MPVTKRGSTTTKIIIFKYQVLAKQLNGYTKENADICGGSPVNVKNTMAVDSPICKSFGHCYSAFV